MGGHRSGDGALTFRVSATEQWASYLFAGADQNQPTADLTNDSNGFQVSASFKPSGSGSTAYEGFGLTFEGDNCVDGSGYTGIAFELSGELGGKLLVVGVAAVGNIAQALDGRGTCAGDASVCYGPSLTVSSVSSPVHVAFDDLTGVMPGSAAQLDRTRIIDLQWQINAGADPSAQFTIENATFY